MARENPNAESHAKALTIDQLPRLTDEEREANESGYVALEGVSAAAERNVEHPKFHHHHTGEAIPGLPSPRPCPFCHAVEFHGIVTNETEGHPNHTTYYVACDHCGCDGPTAGSLLEAAQLWNAATANEPAGNEPNNLPIKGIIRQVERINGFDVATACDALRQFLTIEDEAAENAYPIIECIRAKLQDAKNRIEDLCNQAVRL
jgi:hypothetical protein